MNILIYGSIPAPTVVDLDKMDRSRFREFLHNAFDMTDDILLDRIFKYFDSDNDGYIGREEWIMGLSVFLKGINLKYSLFCNKIAIIGQSFRMMEQLNTILGTEEEHTRYCFDIYDLNGDGVITREEMLTMLKTSLGRQGMDEDPDEGVKV